MRIDTEIKSVIVEIDDKEYEVAAKTVDVAEKLQKAEINARKSGKLAFELWREHLEIVLGRAAVKELFTGGRDENLDRMEAIYYGVMDAFNANGRERRDERMETSASEAKALVDAIKPLVDVLSMLNKSGEIAATPFPMIKRPEAVK